MEQLLSIFLPMWEIELFKRRQRSGHSRPESRSPLLLIWAAKGRQTIARCCPVARRLGIREGMTLSEARALAGGAPQIFPFDPDKSRQALDLLAKWALRFSPVVCVDPIPTNLHPNPIPDGLLLDITGEAHLFGGEHLLLTEIASRLARLGFTSRLAIAPTLGAAWALARFAQNPLTIITGQTDRPSQLPITNYQLLHSVLHPLPVAALRLPLHTCHALDQVGITLIRHLLALPRESLAARFGEEILLRLDQAFGRVPELITPLRPIEPLTVRRIFDGPAIQLEAIMITAQELIGELTGELLKKESGVRGLKLELLRINAPGVFREFILARPTRDPKHLWQLMRPKIEQLHLGYGVEAVTLTAHWTQSIPHQQLGALEEWGGQTAEQENDAHYAAFLDTLINRWGPERVLTANPITSHTPELARQFRPVHKIKPATTSPECALQIKNQKSKIKNSAGENPLVFHDRPTLLFPHPEPAEALALQPDRPPSWLRWRGQEYTLHSGAGPERIVTAWWHDSPHSPRLAGGNATHATTPDQQTPGLPPSSTAASTRDYFKVQTAAGSWLWTFRELETGQWFVQGTWT